MNTRHICLWLAHWSARRSHCVAATHSLQHAAHSTQHTTRSKRYAQQRKHRPSYSIRQTQYSTQHPTYSMQHTKEDKRTTAGMQHATRNIKHPACNTQPAGCSIQQQAYSAQHTAHDFQRTAYRSQHPTYSTQHAAPSTQHAIFGTMWWKNKILCNKVSLVSSQAPAKLRGTSPDLVEGVLRCLRGAPWNLSRALLEPLRGLHRDSPKHPRNHLQRPVFSAMYRPCSTGREHRAELSPLTPGSRFLATSRIMTKLTHRDEVSAMAIERYAAYNPTTSPVGENQNTNH